MNRKSIKWKWLIAIISIILLLSMAAFLTSALLVRSLNEETIRNNENKAELMRNSLDGSWERIFQCSWQIFYSEKAKQLESKNTPGMAAYELRKEFDGYLLAKGVFILQMLYYQFGNVG